MNQLVTRARVLLTDLSYRLVVTQDLQGQVEANFGNTMLLCKSTGLAKNPVNELDGNNMGKTNNSQNIRAMLGKNQQGEAFAGAKSNNKKLAGLVNEPASSRQNQEKGRTVTFCDHGYNIVQHQVTSRAKGKMEQERAGKNCVAEMF